MNEFLEENILTPLLHPLRGQGDLIIFAIPNRFSY